MILAILTIAVAYFGGSEIVYRKPNFLGGLVAFVAVMTINSVIAYIFTGSFPIHILGPSAGAALLAIWKMLRA
jgi:hypothetical protein